MTCRNARSFLRDSKVEFEERDYSRKPFTRQELEDLIGERPITDFLNTRNELYKERNFKERPPSRKQAIDLILEHPNLLRRPILARGKRFVIGFDRDRWKELLQA